MYYYRLERTKHIGTGEYGWRVNIWFYREEYKTAYYQYSKDFGTYFRAEDWAVEECIRLQLNLKHAEVDNNEV